MPDYFLYNAREIPLLEEVRKKRNTVEISPNGLEGIAVSLSILIKEKSRVLEEKYGSHEKPEVLIAPYPSPKFSNDSDYFPLTPKQIRKFERHFPKSVATIIWAKEKSQ
jgi:hypothetical protein